MRRLTIGELSFAHSYRLICGALLIALFLLSQKKYRSYIEFGFTHFLPQDTTQQLRLWIQNILIIAILLSSTLYLAKPQRVEDTDTRSKIGIDIILTLDVSGSMEADDLKPNRLEVAKQVLREFVAQLETDRVGVVVFAGKPFASVPLTFDYHIFNDVLSRLSTQSLDQRITAFQGTAVGDALLHSLHMLEQAREQDAQTNTSNEPANNTKKLETDETREQIIILLTDGKANVGIDPLVASELAVDQNIKVYTVGIGSLQGGSIPYATMFGTRRSKVEGVDEKTLQAIAEKTEAQYRRAENEQTFKEIFATIAELEKTELELEEIVQYKDTGKLFLILLAFCLTALLYQNWKWPVVDGS